MQNYLNYGYNFMRTFSLTVLRTSVKVYELWTDLDTWDIKN